MAITQTVSIQVKSMYWNSKKQCLQSRRSKNTPDYPTGLMIGENMLRSVDPKRNELGGFVYYEKI